MVLFSRITLTGVFHPHYLQGDKKMKTYSVKLKETTIEDDGWEMINMHEEKINAQDNTDLDDKLMNIILSNDNEIEVLKIK